MLISEEYLKQNQEAHKTDPQWGSSAFRYAPLIRALSKELNAESVLDYGAGKQTLKGALPDVNMFCYDPSIEEISQTPDKHDLVCCIDVLEHIEPECLDDVLDDLKRVINKMGFFVISTVKAFKHLPDGRNAHLIVEDETFWIPKILDRFGIGMIKNEGNALTVFVNARPS